MRNLCILTTTALLLTACGGGSSSPAPGSSTPTFVNPYLVTRPAVPGTVGTNDDAESFSISGDGRWVAFEDESADLVPGDTNERDDVYLLDTTTGIGRHITVGAGGEQANENSDYPSLDQDGSHCAFDSEATNLVAGDTNGVNDVFVIDLGTNVISRVSVATDGSQAVGGDSGNPRVSADASVVVFESEATNLVANDTNGTTDIFVHDTSSGVTTRVSLATDGSQSNGPSWSPDISADGRFIVFTSVATNFDASDTNGNEDVYLHDRQTGTTTLVSEALGGGAADGFSGGARISDDGNVIVYRSSAADIVSGDANGQTDIFAHAVTSGITTIVSVDSAGTQATSNSETPRVSGNGQFVFFRSNAANLVMGDTNSLGDLFRHDRQTGTTIRVNTRSDGSQATRGSAEDPAVSTDGTQVAFGQQAGGLSPDGLEVSGVSNGFLKDLTSGNLTLLSPAATRNRTDGPSDNGYALSPNGRWVAFTSDATNLVAGDTNNRKDIFLCDTSTGAIQRVLEATNDPENRHDYFSLCVSNDGRYICFTSFDPNLLGQGIDTNNATDVFVLDTQSSLVERVSVHTDGTAGNSRSNGVQMTPDGRYVLFWTSASNLVDGDGDNNTKLYLRDRTAGTTTRAILDKDGMPIGQSIFGGSISDDGRYVAFSTTNTNMVDSDMNGTEDVFVRDLMMNTNLRISVDMSGGESDNRSGSPRISGDGNSVMFKSAATDLIAGDTNMAEDIFVRDIGAGVTTRISVDSLGNESVGSGESLPRALSFDGSRAMFNSDAVDLFPGLEARSDDGYVFVHDLNTGETVVASVSPTLGLPEDESGTDTQNHCFSRDGNRVLYVFKYLEIEHLWVIDYSQLGN